MTDEMTGETPDLPSEPTGSATDRGAYTSSVFDAVRDPVEPKPEVPSRRREFRMPSLRPTPFRAVVASSVLLGVVSILLGLMVFAPQIAPLKLGSTRLLADARTDEAIEEVASRFARNFMTISYRTFDRDFDRILADTTGSFRREVSKLPAVIKEPYVKSKGISTAEVTEVSVSSRAGDTASVHVVVSRSIQNESEPEPRPVRHTLDLTLVSTSGGWKVAGADSLPNAATGG